MHTAFSRIWCFGLFLALLGCEELAQAQQNTAVGPKPRKYALLIAVNEYAKPLERLEFCINDMTALRDRLVAAGFPDENVALMCDDTGDVRLHPTKANIEAELKNRLQLASENDLFVVAFSGHGLQLNGKSFVCPKDARLGDASATVSADMVDRSMVSIDKIYESLEKCKAREALIIDACRNEPLVKGFKGNAGDTGLDIVAPPAGLCVLSSCNKGQFSTEDPKLRHGVFMNYIIKGLEGEADKDGNNDKRVSLFELYDYAQYMTKNHAYKSFGITQLPMMRGEMVGRIELAIVSSGVVRRESIIEKLKPEVTAPPVRAAAPDPRMIQAKTYLANKQYDHAFAAFNLIIGNAPNEPVAVLREALIGRATIYMNRTAPELDLALIDCQAGRSPGLLLPIKSATASLKVGNDIKGTINQNQIVLITKNDGNWFWVAAVDGNKQITGYIPKSAVLPQPKPAPVYNNNNNYYDDGDYGGGFGGGGFGGGGFGGGGWFD